MRWLTFVALSVLAIALYSDWLGNGRQSAAVGNDIGVAAQRDSLLLPEPDPLGRRRIPARTLRVVEVGSCLPVPGAALTLQEGVSDADGILSLREDVDLSDELIVEHPEYVLWVGTLTEVGPSETIELMPRDSIEGRAVRPVGAPKDLSMITVVAWRGASPRRSDLVRVLSGEWNTALVSTVCRPDGSFSLRAPLGAGPIFIAAGGGGLATSKRDARIASDEGSVEVPLLWLHGTSLEFRSPDGGPVRVSPRATTPRGWGLSLSPHQAMELMTPSDPQVLLNGWVELPGVEEGLSEVTILLLANVVLPTGSGPHLTVDYPGFEKVATNLALQPITEGFNSFVVELRPLAEAFGNIRVEFGPHLQELLADPAARDLLLTLELRSTEYGTSYYHVLGSERGSTVELPSIPIGPLKGALKMPDGTLIPLRGPAGEVELDLPPTGAVYLVDHAAFAWLELDLRHPDGEPYLGPITVDFGPAVAGGRRKSRMVALSGPPHRIPIGTPGTYAGALIQPALLDLESSSGHYFEIGADSTVRISVLLPGE